MDQDKPTPSHELLKAVRVRLLLKGVTMTFYAGQKGVKRENLRRALLGQWFGPKARRLVRDVVDNLKDDPTE